MAQERKQLLIVDDTEIDRIILKSILCREFDVMEANSGNVAFEYITKQSDQLDGILLDISMPHIDGFDVLKFMEDKGVSHIPVFLVTAEPTRDNVEKAMHFKIAEFISKPFDQEDVLRRLRSRLGVVPDYNVDENALKATWAYISELETLYKKYLANFDKKDDHYTTISDLMRIMLNTYTRTLRTNKLVPESVELISKAAYFCDIGEMFIPDKRLQILEGHTKIQELKNSHTQIGASLIRLNHDKSCEYFVQICADMCLHHHERYDGLGYPDGLYGKNNSIFNQMCHVIDEFEQRRAKFYGDKSRPVKFVVRQMVGNDSDGLVSPEVCALFEDCEPQFLNYFMKKNT